MKPSDQLESLLGISLPEDYRKFIDETGYLPLGNISTEVYGFRPEFDVKKIPSVIAATNLNSEDYELNHNEIVISHTGYEGHIVILDTTSGGIYELGLNRNKEKIADTFSSWLSVMVSKNEVRKRL